MRILVVGGGGREHALAWKLSQEAEVFASPGNPGIAEDCETFDIAASDSAGLVELCAERAVDLVVVGPEDPLVAGLADILRMAGVNVFGPGAEGAKLEASKAFSKDAMAAAGVPTAAYANFTDAHEAKTFARRRFETGRAVAVKASGNALGKGVVVAETSQEAEAAIDRMMLDRAFGSAGDTVVIEDRLVGREFSLLTIVGDHNFVSLPVAQDHKRAFDGDLGPNTGGMGSFSPVDWLPDGLVDEVEQTVVAPILAHLRAQGIQYRGMLFSGLMMDRGRPYCLEYNVRFGDPETQSVMMRLGQGFAKALHQAATGVPIEAPEVLPNAAVSVVVASGGYPGEYKKRLPISIHALPPGVKIFHAGTALDDGQLVTNGGRVLCVSAAAKTAKEARSLAYEGVNAIAFEGAFSRSDIASEPEGTQP